MRLALRAASPSKSTILPICLPCGEKEIPSIG
jgi:hypothetical protein